MEPTSPIELPAQAQSDAASMRTVMPMNSSTCSQAEHKNLVVTLMDKLPSELSPTKKKPLKRKATCRGKGNATTAWTGKPRRPLSAYNFFFKEERAILLAERKSLENSKELLKGTEFFSAMGKLIAKRWKELPPSKMAKYQSLAEQDLKRYRVEKGEYVETKHKNMGATSEIFLAKERALAVGGDHEGFLGKKGASICSHSLRDMLFENSRLQSEVASIAATGMLLRPDGVLWTEQEPSMLPVGKYDGTPLQLPFATNRNSYNDSSSLFIRHLQEQNYAGPFERHGAALSSERQLTSGFPVSRTSAIENSPLLTLSRIDQMREQRARNVRAVLESHALGERGRILTDNLLATEPGVSVASLARNERVFLSSGYGISGGGKDRACATATQYEIDSLLEAQLRLLANRDEAIQSSLDMSSGMVQTLLRNLQGVPHMAPCHFLMNGSAEALKSNKAALSLDQYLNSTISSTGGVVDKILDSTSGRRSRVAEAFEDKPHFNSGPWLQQPAMIDNAASRRVLPPSSVALLLSALNSQQADATNTPGSCHAQNISFE